MEKHSYKILNGFWDNGTWRAPGDADLLMTERAARVHVMAGDIERVEVPSNGEGN